MNNYYKIFINCLIFILAIKVYNHGKNKIYLMKNKLLNKRLIYDVLFINGCDPNILPHPYR